MKPFFFYNSFWVFAFLMLAIGMFSGFGLLPAFGQTNIPINLPEAFPKDKEHIWLVLITPATFFITWMLGKVPPLPKPLLPWLTPVIGIAIGKLFDIAAGADWPWWSEAGAGAIAVTLYEGVKGLSGAGPSSMLTPTPKPPAQPERAMPDLM